MHPLNGIASVITGVRRCGKSTLLAQLAKAWKLAPGQAVFVNFEDPRLLQHLDHRLLEQIHQVAIANASGPITFFLDEIQHVSGWQRWINAALELKSEDTFVLTGSNSTLLSGELASSLTGRHIRTELFPFDLEEFHKVHPGASLKRFLDQGGFPAALAFPEPQQLLRQYFTDIIEKDVRERVSARSTQPLKALAQMVFESVGSETSLRRLAGTLGISSDTVSLYLQACEDAYLLFGCQYFAYSEAKRRRRNKKYYAVDTGLRRAVSTRAGADDGKDFENLVYLTLRKKTEEVFYWRGKAEVDFVVNTPRGVTPIQVTLDQPKERHERGLREFYEQFPHAGEALIVTKDTFAELVNKEL